MTRVTRAALFLLALLASLPVVTGADSESDQELLATARTTRVSKIESGLPDLPVGAWLSSFVGSDAPLSWALNDCGEQTGVPEVDSARDLPVCAELEASLTRGRSVYIYFVVGTQSKGVVESRSLYFAGVLGGDQNLTFPSLSALAAYFRGERE